MSRRPVVGYFKEKNSVDGIPGTFMLIALFLACIPAYYGGKSLANKYIVGPEYLEDASADNFAIFPVTANFFVILMEAAVLLGKPAEKLVRHLLSRCFNSHRTSYQSLDDTATESGFEIVAVPGVNYWCSPQNIVSLHIPRALLFIGAFAAMVDMPWSLIALDDGVRFLATDGETAAREGGRAGYGIIIAIQACLMLLQSITMNNINIPTICLEERQGLCNRLNDFFREHVFVDHSRLAKAKAIVEEASADLERVVVQSTDTAITHLQEPPQPPVSFSGDEASSEPAAIVLAP